MHLLIRLMSILGLLALLSSFSVLAAKADELPPDTLYRAEVTSWCSPTCSVNDFYHPENYFGESVWQRVTSLDICTDYVVPSGITFSVVYADGSFRQGHVWEDTVYLSNVCSASFLREEVSLPWLAYRLQDFCQASDDVCSLDHIFVDSENGSVYYSSSYPVLFSIPQGYHFVFSLTGEHLDGMTEDVGPAVFAARLVHIWTTGK